MQELPTKSPATSRPSRAPVVLFVVLALLGGAELLIIYPPMQVHDEGSHFARAYQVSEGGWLPLKRRGETGGVLPDSLLGLIQACEATTWHAESRIDKPTEFYRDLFQIKLEPENRAFAAFPKTTAEPPLAFLPQAIGIRAARLASDSALATLYAARIANLLVSILCIAAAIRVTPIYKWVFACVALLPLVLVEFASATGYGPTISVVFLFVALVLRLAYGGSGPATRGQIAALLVLTAALCLVMQGYFPLVLLYFLIPPSKLGGMKRYLLVFAVLALLAVGSMVGWHVAQAPYYSPAKPGVDAAEQLRFIREHPREFGTILKANMGQPPLLHLMGMAYSGVLVTDNLNPSILIVPLGALALFFVCFLDATPGIGHISWRNRLLTLGIAALSVLTAFIWLYLFWMPVGAPRIYIHSRQLVPAGLVFLLCFVNLTPRLGRFAGFARRHLAVLVALYFPLRFIESYLSVIHRYYSHWDWWH